MFGCIWGLCYGVFSMVIVLQKGRLFVLHSGFFFCQLGAKAALSHRQFVLGSVGKRVKRLLFVFRGCFKHLHLQ